MPPPAPPKETLGLVAIECLFGCAESSILNYLMHSLANVNACLTLCYFIGLFRIKIGDSAQPRKYSTSPTLFPMRGWGLSMRLYLPGGAPAASWPELGGGLQKVWMVVLSYPPASSILTDCFIFIVCSQVGTTASVPFATIFVQLSLTVLVPLIIGQVIL